MQEATQARNKIRGRGAYCHDPDPISTHRNTNAQRYLPIREDKSAYEADVHSSELRYAES